MKKGRKKDHKWRFVKYKGNLAIYAHCSCGFEYDCSKNESDKGFKIVIAPEKLYNYCLICGSKKTHYEEEIKVVDLIEYLEGRNDR